MKQQALFSSTEVVQVNIPAATGDMGILANHVPSIEALRPGVVEVIESGNTSQKFFGECLHAFDCNSMVSQLVGSLWWLCYRAPK